MNTLYTTIGARVNAHRIERRDANTHRPQQRLQQAQENTRWIPVHWNVPEVFTLPVIESSGSIITGKRVRPRTIIARHGASFPECGFASQKAAEFVAETLKRIALVGNYLHATLSAAATAYPSVLRRAFDQEP